MKTSNTLQTNLALLVTSLQTGMLSLHDYLEQLEAVFEVENKRILAFVPEEGRFDRLRRDAAALEARFPNPDDRPLLYGVPIGVKDIYHVDGFPTRAGSQLPVEVLAGPEAASVTLLKNAGALILGKAATTEFAYFGPGPTRNPHNTAHTPGGSSSGSAAAVGAGICPLALGTQTAGSVVRPAAFCGAVGFKPSSGRISTAGIIPLSPSLDHVGFFTQDVEGASLAASVLCNEWDSASTHIDGRPVLGIPGGPYLEKTSPEGLLHFEATQEKLKAAGFILKQIDIWPDFDEIVIWHVDLMASDAAAVHKDWYVNYGNLYHPKTVALLERGQPITAEAVQHHRQSQLVLRDKLHALMTTHCISAWIAPPAPGPAPVGLDSTGDPIMNLPWTFTGVPAFSLPAGTTQNSLPLGLQLIGRWQKDERLVGDALTVAAALARTPN